MHSVDGCKTYRSTFVFHVYSTSVRAKIQGKGDEVLECATIQSLCWMLSRSVCSQEDG